MIKNARNNLLDFTRFTYPRYVPDTFHVVLANVLNALVFNKSDIELPDGRKITKPIRRLIVTAPPQSGKSRLVSKQLPAFWLAQRRDDPVILTTYGSFLAETHSRDARGIVESEAFNLLFPNITTDKERRAVAQWNLNSPHEGGLLAVGCGGPITGHGALLGIIDDPFQNWEEAQSPTVRETKWQWYQGTFLGRIWENGIIVILMTRWHPEDLAGRLLQYEGTIEQGGDWLLLRFPAISEEQEERDEINEKLGLPRGLGDLCGRKPNEPLTPSRFSLETMLKIKESLMSSSSVVWQAEYQGFPVLPGGNRFKREWFQFIQMQDVPENAKFVRWWDKAATDGGQGPYTCGVLVAKSGDMCYIVDVVRGRWNAGKRDEIMLQVAYEDRARWGYVTIGHEQEPGSGGKESAEATDQMFLDAGFAVVRSKPTTNKDARLEPFAAATEHGKIKLVMGKWNASFLDELLSIPVSPYRDQSDAVAGAYNHLMISDRTAVLKQAGVFGRGR